MKRDDLVRKQADAARFRARRAIDRMDSGRTQKMRRLGPYLLLGKIGSGPTGRVYLGNNVQFNRPSAVKILRKRFEGDVSGLLAQFRQAIKLDHPNIASTLAVEQVRDRVCIVSRYVEASPVSEFSLSPQQVLEVMIEVAAAVESAHHAGVAHGNLKPGNILLGEKGEAYVTDFCVPPSTSEVLYFPPEHAGGPAKPTREADVYSMGAILYYLLTQRAPFSADSPLQALQRIAEFKLESPRRWNPAIRPDLEAVVLKAMARRPRDRYRSAMEFAADLRDVQEVKTPLAVRERRRAAALRVSLVAGVILAVAGGAALAVFAPRSPVVPAPSEPPPVAAGVPPPPGEERPDPRPILPPPAEPAKPSTPVAVEPPPPPELPRVPELPLELVRQVRDEVLKVHAHYLQTLLLPEERARLQELADKGRGTDADAAFLRGRVLGEVMGAVREDLESLRAGAGPLESDVGAIADRVEAVRKEGKWLELARWCGENGHPKGRAYALYQHLGADPGHEEARRELGYRRTPSGLWRKELIARSGEGGIEFEGRLYGRDALRRLLLERGYVVVNDQWCKTRPWTPMARVAGLENAALFHEYRWKMESIFDPFSKVDLEIRRFEPRWSYYGPNPVDENSDRCAGVVVIPVASQDLIAECRVRVPARVIDKKGAITLWLEAEGQRTKVYELSEGESHELVDVSGMVRGRRSFTLRAELRAAYDGRDRRHVQFLPGDKRFEIVARLAEPIPEITRLLGKDAPSVEPERARKMMDEAAGRLVRPNDAMADAVIRMGAEAELLRYEGPLETPLEFEGLARLIGSPLTFDPAKLSGEPADRLRQAWEGFDLPRRRAFASWFGLWYARERSREK